MGDRNQVDVHKDQREMESHHKVAEVLHRDVVHKEEEAVEDDRANWGMVEHDLPQNHCSLRAWNEKLHREDYHQLQLLSINGLVEHQRVEILVETLDRCNEIPDSF